MQRLKMPKAQLGAALKKRYNMLPSIVEGYKQGLNESLQQVAHVCKVCNENVAYCRIILVRFSKQILLL
jgi:hypothetical protein